MMQNPDQTSTIHTFILDGSPADIAFREWAEQFQRDLMAELGYSPTSPDFDSAGYYHKAEHSQNKPVRD